MSECCEFGHVSEISKVVIPEKSYVVFDWDNTLKLINREKRELVGSVTHSFLSDLKEKRHCELFVISAIRPSRINMDSLLIEMNRLGFTDIFANDEDKVKVGNNYVQKGHIMICGYDKAERFLDVFLKNEEEESSEEEGDVPDGLVEEKSVVFFDDELVNVTNFSSLVPNSKCYHVKAQIS